MLVVEIDEKGHVDRDPDYEKKRQKELQKLGYHLIRINLDKMDFNDYDEFGRVSAYMIKSTKNQTKKSLIDDLSKRLSGLEFKSKCLKWVVEKIMPTIKDMKNTQSKIKPIKRGKKPGSTYCLGCKDYTDNFKPQEVKMINEVLKEKSNYVVCRSSKSRLLKQKQDNINRQFVLC